MKKKKPHNPSDIYNPLDDEEQEEDEDNEDDEDSKGKAITIIKVGDVYLESSKATISELKDLLIHLLNQKEIQTYLFQFELKKMQSSAIGVG